MAESNTFVGVTSGVMDRGTYQKLTSAQMFSKDVQWACFNKTPFMQAVGLEAYGVEAVKDLQAFGSAKPTGRIIRLDNGVHSFSGSIFETCGTSFHVGRFGSYTPELVEGGDQYAYSYHELVNTQFIPENDIDDNGKGDIDIKIQKMAGMKQAFVRDINYCFLGNSSAPDAGTMGPSSVYSDLPNLISVTQSRLVGGITKSSDTYWGNGAKEIASVGSSGDMDRPITLRRSMMAQANDQAVYAETSMDYLHLCTQGFWQYYDRLMYADTVETGKFPVSQKYDMAGIQHKIFNGGPLLWDPAVTIPWGATGSTEACYGIHIPTFGIAIRTEKNFQFKGWEPPRQHDDPKSHVATLDTRYTPFVTAMRSHWVAYDIPASPD